MLFSDIPGGDPAIAGAGCGPGFPGCPGQGRGGDPPGHGPGHPLHPPRPLRQQDPGLTGRRQS